MAVTKAPIIRIGKASRPIMDRPTMAMKATYEPIMYTSPWAKLIMPMMP